MKKAYVHSAKCSPRGYNSSTLDSDCATSLAETRNVLCTYKKAQASLEYTLLIGILIVVLLGVLYFVNQDFMNTVNLRQAEDAVSKIAYAADEVYSLGPGAKNSVWVTLPSSTADFSINNSEVIIILKIFKGTSDIYKTSKANLTGNINLGSSLTKKIVVEMLDSGAVNVSST